jgi:hypothetical protein
LRTREEAESKARLRELKGGGRERKRRRDDDEEDARRDRKPRIVEREGRWTNVLAGLGGRQGESGRRNEAHTGGSRPSRNDRRHDRSDRGTDEEHHSERDRLNDRSRKAWRGEIDGKSYRSERATTVTQTHSRQPDDRLSEATQLQKQDTTDSDPLEDLIGPSPATATKARGRGASKSSTINSRFSSSYDPKTDVTLDHADEGDDWEMALEALRDRAKWKAKGAERLRAAGFTDEEVGKWEKGGEKDVNDVRWRRKGEGREWDRGKTLDGKGEVDIKAEWAK